MKWGCQQELTHITACPRIFLCLSLSLSVSVWVSPSTRLVQPLQPSLWDALKQAHYGGFKLYQPATDQLISEKFTRATSREVGNYRNFPQVF